MILYGLRTYTDATDIGIQSRKDVAERIIGMLTRQYHVPLKAKRLISVLSKSFPWMMFCCIALYENENWKIVAKKETITM